MRLNYVQSGRSLGVRIRRSVYVLDTPKLHDPTGVIIDISTKNYAKCIAMQNYELLINGG